MVTLITGTPLGQIFMICKIPEINLSFLFFSWPWSPLRSGGWHGTQGWFERILNIWFDLTLNHPPARRSSHSGKRSSIYITMRRNDQTFCLTKRRFRITNHWLNQLWWFHQYIPIQKITNAFVSDTQHLQQRVHWCLKHLLLQQTLI